MLCPIALQPIKSHKGFLDSKILWKFLIFRSLRSAATVRGSTPKCSLKHARFSNRESKYRETIAEEISFLKRNDLLEGSLECFHSIEAMCNRAFTMIRTNLLDLRQQRFML
jgi:hypothetical protein